MKHPSSAFALAALFSTSVGFCQDGAIPQGFDRQEYLRGTITPERAWWNVLHYDLSLTVLPESKSLRGCNTITFLAEADGKRLQIDLQPPLAITRVLHAGRELASQREGKVYWVDFPSEVTGGSEQVIEVHYEGKPRPSTRPPWSGGLSWKKDDKGVDFIATTCQGIGASIWWPNKDHGADEPDRGMDMRITVPEALTAVSNGRLMATTADKDAKTRTFHWRVVSPINNYGVNVNIGNYVAMDSTFQGEGGKLDLQYWVLEHQVEQAKQQFVEAPRTLAAFEHWFGKYPFYADGYKLVVVPYLGMEHQSSVTYGNGFRNGYQGTDLSKTGVGLKFDFIIVHESAHEWWGNNISMQDAADMWIHESFANYAENLFVEYHFTASEAQDYVIGCRKLIRNDKPIIGVYGVNNSGSGDMYYKGGNMLHTMRHMLHDDGKWRTMLRGLNAEFAHKTVTTADVEAYISKTTGQDFSLVFDQYLRTTKVPTLCYRKADKGVSLWLENVVPGFAAPLALRVNDVAQRLVVSETAQVLKTSGELRALELDRNFYFAVSPK